MFSDPPNRQAPPLGTRLEVTQWPSCLRWRIPWRGLAIKIEGEAVPQIRQARLKAPPAFLFR